METAEETTTDQDPMMLPLTEREHGAYQAMNAIMAGEGGGIITMARSELNGQPITVVCQVELAMDPEASVDERVGMLFGMLQGEAVDIKVTPLFIPINEYLKETMGDPTDNILDAIGFGPNLLNRDDGPVVEETIDS